MAKCHNNWTILNLHHIDNCSTMMIEPLKGTNLISQVLKEEWNGAGLRVNSLSGEDGGRQVVDLGEH